MQKSYLLLRHNQQSGPFSLDELAGMSLQPKDLIWVIGQSAGWRYPEEIEAVKNLVPGASSSPAALPTQTELSDQQTPAAYSAQEARHIYVSLPPVAVVSSQPATAEATPSFSFEERVEQMRQRASAVSQPHTDDETLEVETKYSRSLDDIKAEYSNWMRTQKHNRNKRPGWKPVLAVTAIGLAALGVWWVVGLSIAPTSKQALVNNASEAAKEKEFYPTVVLPPKLVSSSDVTKPEKAPTNRATNKQSRKTTVVPEVDTPSPDTSTLQQASTQNSEVLADANEVDETISRDSANNTATRPATVAEQLLINAEYVAGTKNSTGVEGLAVTVKNTSNQLMKVVAVDVIYFVEGMEELERKTLYFSNLQPGQALTRNAPAHKKAEGAYAQLGLISSEEGRIFYASSNR